MGAGQLGSRYLQGLGALKDQVAITVVDPSEASLAVARKRLAEILPVAEQKVQWSMSLEDAGAQMPRPGISGNPFALPASVDEDLAKSHTVKAWILERC